MRRIAALGLVLLGISSLTDAGTPPLPVESALVDAAGGVTISSPGPDNLQFQIQPTTGQFTGSFTHPVLNTTIYFKGVALQIEGAGGGYFLGTNESGFVIFEPAP